MECPSCHKYTNDAEQERCDNGCGTNRCPYCETVYYNEEKKVIIGHDPDCGQEFDEPSCPCCWPKRNTLSMACANGCGALLCDTCGQYSLVEYPVDDPDDEIVTVDRNHREHCHKN